MASYTEGLLRDNLREVKGWASALTSLLKAEKLKLPNSKSYNESIMKFETRTKNIAVNIVMLETANRERQERKLEMPQEDFNSAVLTDLVKSRQLLVQLKEVGGDLGKLRVMAMSSLERLEIKPSSVRISKNSLQKMTDLHHQCRLLRRTLLLVQASRRRRSTRLRSGFTFER
jgi:hypothetical protein